MRRVDKGESDNDEEEEEEEEGGRVGVADKLGGEGVREGVVVEEEEEEGGNDDVDGEDGEGIWEEEGETRGDVGRDAID